MYRLVAGRLPIDQTARVGSVIGIVLNYLALENAGEYPVERQLVSVSFFIGVVCNPYPIMANSFCDVLDMHGRRLTYTVE